MGGLLVSRDAPLRYSLPAIGHAPGLQHDLAAEAARVDARMDSACGCERQAVERFGQVKFSLTGGQTLRLFGRPARFNLVSVGTINLNGASP